MPPTPPKLRLVTAAPQVRQSIEAFNTLPIPRDLARDILRRTEYWVHDPVVQKFGPSKFVGFAGVTYSLYQRARELGSSGDRFDGAVTRKQLERVLGSFTSSEELGQRLAAWADALLGEPAFAGIDRTAWKFVVIPELQQPAAARASRAWAFLSTPGLYRVEDAVRDLQEDTWTTGGSDVRKGDRVVIWKAAGRDGTRGVVALGEVLTDPAEVSDDSNPYWTDLTSAREPRPRVRVRYVKPPQMPLWLDAFPELLGALSVSRGQGSRAFKVTEEQWSALLEAGGGSQGRLGPPPSGILPGEPYRPANEDFRSKYRDPFETDPDTIDRGNRGHNITQNALAAFLQERGVEPRSCGAADCRFDLLWEHRGVRYVAEVKSVTDENEEEQLRLGLGQVLRYRHLCGASVTTVAVLVAEREPSDRSWLGLCGTLGVCLTWPGAFERIWSTDL